MGIVYVNQEVREMRTAVDTYFQNGFKNFQEEQEYEVTVKAVSYEEHALYYGEEPKVEEEKELN